MGIIASLLIILGYIAIINKNPAGFTIQFIGCTIMAGLYLWIDWGVVLVNTAFGVINVIGWIKWSKEQDETR